MDDIRGKLGLAQHHLKRVQSAWEEPTDWDDLSLYGFYALEAAVDCAAMLLLESPQQKTHPARVDAARNLTKHGFPNVADLLRDLNEARKSVAYGDTELPDMDAAEVASRIESYVRRVANLVAGGAK